MISENLVCDKSQNYCDFIPFRALDGLIAINVYDQSYADVYVDQLNSNGRKIDISGQDLKSYSYTLISFDYGETFKRITKP